MHWLKKYWNRLIEVILETLGICVIGVAVGIFAHQSDKYIKLLPRSDVVKQVVRYVIGVISAFPLFLFMAWWRVGIDGEQLISLGITYFVVFSSVGAGVVLGHWGDSHR